MSSSWKSLIRPLPVKGFKSVVGPLGRKVNPLLIPQNIYSDTQKCDKDDPPKPLASVFVAFSAIVFSTWVPSNPSLLKINFSD